MPIDVSINVLGVPVIQRKIGAAADACRDFRPVWAALHAGKSSDPLLRGSRHGPATLSFVDIITQHFASKGSRGGTPWPNYDREPIYKKIKLKHGGGLDRMLRWRPGFERLFPSLVEASHPQHVFRSSAFAAEFGTSVPYAKNHQFGQGWQKWDKIPVPKRPIIALRKDDAHGWTRAMARFIEIRAKAAGLSVGAVRQNL